MNYKISPLDINRITLNETDTAASVLQNIAIILGTLQQSVPMHRGIGLSREIIDKPIDVAKNLTVIEVMEAIRRYEPRATFVGITFNEDENVPGKLIPIVEVKINEQ